MWKIDNFSLSLEEEVQGRGEGHRRNGKLVMSAQHIAIIFESHFSFCSQLF